MNASRSGQEPVEQSGPREHDNGTVCEFCTPIDPEAARLDHDDTPPKMKEGLE